MNRYAEINGKMVWDKQLQKLVFKPAEHYNRNAVRQRQGKTRKRRVGYVPRFLRAKQHVMDDRLTDREKARLIELALQANMGDALL